MADEVTNTASGAENARQDAPVADATPVEQASTEEVTEKTSETTEPAVAEEVPVSEYAHLKPGQVVKIHLKIKDVTPKGEERERIQVFEGTIIARKGQDVQSRTITVRKVSGGIGVERIFPLKMPAIDKIETVKELRTRRSKLYFTRNYKKKLREVKKSVEAKK
jgi:large subunit ribosomal protein L19